ncbi:bifunctional pyr operon transcriptional regulator/uracil phosphoribosyltransferase PyrR [Plasticicumulans acidivorans]|uniref:Pyrimidine operon attenuation protein/uracil phosphoribosyltransferase n=1 Tax=Plasticicumulans acidivorans TaxID=886464 RepID=A0A317MVE3_9GAMM|nr:bifunctional pyr operon transcriptional regulator/uracil phosphoribosyltransferase PyrR [Plasticicumulans acidivorans]PWV62315.1 pyrimidine operon attenuation protein/uracil phosphoribosyltransferase [Plasticicumulans acidivorans]
MLDPEQLSSTLAERLRVLLASRGITAPALIGIRSGGAWIAARLQAALDLPGEPGTLDISFYRDDFSRVGLDPQVRPSQIPFDIDARDIVLVDDVLHTGRTIRAALNEIFDYGRPRSVVLAVLVERDGRELPVQADVAATRLTLGADEYVRLDGPNPLSLTIQKRP